MLDPRRNLDQLAVPAVGIVIGNGQEDPMLNRSIPKRVVSAACLVLAISLASFSYWGLYTESGRHAYDEMDGIIPLAAAPLSVCFAVCAVLAWLLGKRGVPASVPR